MIININGYVCSKCGKIYKFDTSKEYSDICPDCKVNLKFLANFDMDTEKPPEKVPETQPGQYLRYMRSKGVTCPYCESNDVEKISTFSKVIDATFGGVFALPYISKEFHCNNCRANF